MPKYQFTFRREARVPFIGTVEVEGEDMEQAENSAEILLMQGRVSLSPVTDNCEFVEDAVIIHRENVSPVSTSILVRVHIADTPKEAYTRLCEALSGIEAGPNGVPFELDSQEYTTLRDGEPESAPRSARELWPTEPEAIDKLLKKQSPMLHE